MQILRDKIIPFDKIGALAAELSERGKRIVFTNGCFDILHAGHVAYLSQAKALGDVLILGLNSDASVRRLKGASRPVNAQHNRALVLAGLSAVDYICIFEEDTPYELIKEVLPHILVKGGDWAPKDIVGSDIVLDRGGEVRSLDFVEGLSTTGIIKKLSIN